MKVLGLLYMDIYESTPFIIYESTSFVKMDIYETTPFIINGHI